MIRVLPREVMNRIETIGYIRLISPSVGENVQGNIRFGDADRLKAAVQHIPPLERRDYADFAHNSSQSSNSLLSTEEEN